jgi:hypothetical protein
MTMVSGWWLLLAFVLGIYGGVSLMAVLSLASREADDLERLPEAIGPSW